MRPPGGPETPYRPLQALAPTALKLEGIHDSATLADADRIYPSSSGEFGEDISSWDFRNFDFIYVWTDCSTEVINI